MREGGKANPVTGNGSEASASSTNRTHPPSFYCPISCQCMHDPVVLTDGHTYERRHIAKWLRNSNASPVTGVQLESALIVPNHTLRNAIEEYFEDVLGAHRQAISEAAEVTVSLTDDSTFSDDSALRRTIDSLMQCSILVNADLSVELVLTRIMQEAKTLLGTEVASVFLVDREKHELCSTVNSTGGELRIPMSSGVAGHVALSGSALIINDAYADPHFNADVDSKTGFRTRNILCVPMRASDGGVLGVAQLINKTDHGILKLVRGGIASGAETEDEHHHPLNFTSSDLHFFDALASQAGFAVDSSGLFECVPQDVAPSKSLSNSADASSSARKHKRSYLGRPSGGGSEGHSANSQAVGTSGGGASQKTVVNKFPFMDDCDAVTQVLLDAFGSWEMDVLVLEELTNGRPLSSLARFLFEKTGLVAYFGMNLAKLDNFLTEIERGYPVKNQYHNRAHATSVLHIVHAILHLGGVAEAVSLAVIDIEDADSRRYIVTLSSLLAAIVHDYEHLGLNNEFLVKTSHKRAIMYNDRSPNENHHAAAAFALLTVPEYNFLDCLDSAKFIQVRKLAVDLVLGTDMAEGSRILTAFNQAVGVSVAPVKSGGESNSGPKKNVGGRCSGSKRFPESPREGSLSLQIVLKCADLGHLSLGWAGHLHWVRLLEAEFFAQGDQEKRLGFAKVSFLMDRDHHGVSQTQIGFFNFVALPLFRCLVSAFPATSPICTAVETNYLRWSESELRPS